MTKASNFEHETRAIIDDFMSTVVAADETLFCK